MGVFESFDEVRHSFRILLAHVLIGVVVFQKFFYFGLFALILGFLCRYVVCFGVFLGVASGASLAGFMLVFVWLDCEWCLGVEPVLVVDCEGGLVHEVVSVFECEGGLVHEAVLVFK